MRVDPAKNSKEYRQFIVNSDSDTYYKMINWQMVDVHEPQLKRDLSEELTNNAIATGDTIDDYFPNFPCHTIKLATEASALVSEERNRNGLSRISSQNKNLKFDTKKYYNA